MQATSDFRNIAKLPKGEGFQLKFKTNGEEYQPYAANIGEAISKRNDYYLDNNYRPARLFKKFYTLECIAPIVGIDSKSGNPYHRWQVHARILESNEYKPKSFADHDEAVEFTTKWIASHNAIAAIYNGRREEMFLKWIEQERVQNTPHIEVEFDAELWRSSARLLFGTNVPDFFVEDNDRSPIWVPKTQHVFTAKEMGYGKQKETQYRSKKIVNGFTAAVKKYNSNGASFFVPGFVVAGGGTGHRLKFFKISPQTPFLKAYIDAVEHYVFIHALGEDEKERLYSMCPPKDIFYLDYKRRYDDGEEISVVEILGRLELDDFNLENIRL